jgi:hypothetical protein
LNSPDLDKVAQDNNAAVAAQKELMHAALDAGPAAVPELRNLLQRSNTELSRTGPVLGDRISPELLRKVFAIGVLTLIGGSDATSVLQKEYENGYKEAALALASALSSSDSPQSRAMLTGFLAKDPEDDREKEVIIAAAYSLGLLRVREAVPRLRVLAQGPAGRDTTAAAKLALQWIEKGPWTITSQPNDDRQAILAAILKVGIADGNHEYLLDETGGGFWRYSPAGWTFARGKAPSSGPEVDDILMSSDVSRALVSISTDGGDYTYSLRKDGREWKVQMFGRN